MSGRNGPLVPVFCDPAGRVVMASSTVTVDGRDVVRLAENPKTGLWEGIESDCVYWSENVGTKSGFTLTTRDSFLNKHRSGANGHRTPKADALRRIEDKVDGAIDRLDVLMRELGALS